MMHRARRQRWLFSTIPVSREVAPFFESLRGAMDDCYVCDRLIVTVLWLATARDSYVNALVSREQCYKRNNR